MLIKKLNSAVSLNLVFSLKNNHSLTVTKKKIGLHPTNICFWNIVLIEKWNSSQIMRPLMLWFLAVWVVQKYIQIYKVTTC